MNENFFESLVNYKNLNRSSFHTPGHKCSFQKLKDLFLLDFTELPATDSLYEACGIIKTAEKAVSKLYGSAETVFSSGGNTLCIQAMIYMCAQAGDKILCDRVVHRSAVCAMALLNITPVWIKRTANKNSGLSGKIDIKNLETQLEKNKNIKAVYITSPDYYGNIQDINKISKVCLKYSIPVLVDNAHGAHLKFFGMHPLDMGASLVADSAHKTLPVFTGGAWLHAKTKQFKTDPKSAMALFGSTSPSYPVMASMDICRAWMEEKGEEEYLLVKARIDEIKQLARSRGIFLPSQDSLCDPVRLTLQVSSIGYSGFEFREELYKFKIEPEFCDRDHVVFIPTPFNSPEDFYRLEKAIEKMDLKEPVRTEFANFSLPLPKVAETLTKAIMGKRKKIKVKNSLGCIAAEIACPCPPGVPVVMPGETIGLPEMESLLNYGIFEINVLE